MLLFTAVKAVFGKPSTGTGKPSRQVDAGAVAGFRTVGRPRVNGPVAGSRPQDVEGRQRVFAQAWRRRGYSARPAILPGLVRPHAAEIEFSLDSRAGLT